MIFTVLGGGAIGLIYILGLAFATADIPKVRFCFFLGVDS